MIKITKKQTALPKLEINLQEKLLKLQKRRKLKPMPRVATMKNRKMVAKMKLKTKKIAATKMMTQTQISIGANKAGSEITMTSLRLRN